MEFKLAQPAYGFWYENVLDKVNASLAMVNYYSDLWKLTNLAHVWLNLESNDLDLSSLSVKCCFKKSPKFFEP